MEFLGGGQNGLKFSRKTTPLGLLKIDTKGNKGEQIVSRQNYTRKTENPTDLSISVVVLQECVVVHVEILFASCTDTFSKWYKITRGMKRSAQ
jgi:hypothetical protein